MMEIQKKMVAVLLTAFLTLCIFGVSNAQITLKTSPNVIPNTVNKIYHLFPYSIGVPKYKTRNFYNNLSSNLPYLASQHTPDVLVTSKTETQLTIEMLGTSTIVSYRVGIFDLETGQKSILTTTNNSIDLTFPGDGLHVVVVHSQSATHASRMSTIIIEKQVMKPKSEIIECECEGAISIPQSYSKPLFTFNKKHRSFPWVDISACQNAQYKMEVALENETSYEFTWEVNFVEEEIIMSTNCGDMLSYVGVIGINSEEPSTLMLKSADDIVFIMIHENAVVIYSQIYIATTTMSKCCLPTPSSFIGLPSSPTTASSAKFNNYPNPCQEELTVDFELEEDQTVEVQLISPQGTVLTNWEKESLQKGSHARTFDVSAYANGIYYLLLKSKEETQLKKIVLLK